MRGSPLALALLCAVGIARPLAGGEAQAPAGPRYADETARRLHEAAMAAQVRRDDSVVEYTALVRQRIGASLRMPLKDRTLFRSESAQRVFWHRDGMTVVQVLAAREQTPLGVDEDATHPVLFDRAFDPLGDRLLFGFADPGDFRDGESDGDDFRFEHPLSPDFADRYRYATGDTLTLSLPDGRKVVAVELQVVPLQADVHRMTGSLWIEPGSGALVRAVYRLSEPFDAFRDLPDLREEEDDDLKHVPGLFKPWTFELSMIAVDYALWDFDLWLPRSMRAEGVARAGVLTAPAAVDMSYEMESVVTDEDEAQNGADEAALPWESDVPYVVDRGWSRRTDSRGRRTVRYLVPEDPSYLATSPFLPPPIWDDAPGFTSQEELNELFSRLSDLPDAPRAAMPATFRWGLQRPDLLRYNRVEGLSLGARGQIRPTTFLGPLSLTATVRLGSGDREPDARLDATRETLRRRVTWSVFRELAPVDEDARDLGLGNSLTALLFGRDSGDYYRRSGTWLEWTPPSAERPSFRVRAYAEYHEGVEASTDFNLWHVADGAWAFRPNRPADEGWELGGLVTVAPWWGTDPRAAQGGLELTVQGAGGDFDYARASLVARTALPLPSDFRLAVEAGAGTSWGSPPPQRMWLVGGASSLRGFAPATAVGTSFARARGEVARRFSFGAVSLFSDAGWAGDRSDAHGEDVLASVGLGLSLVDGLLRVDGARGVRGGRDFRLEFYLDGIL
ncbi:MAG TPA: hypothetical protein VJ997_01220 [Longimicrobiales bacterium]|nr:hypothetical protein [Longimicrobiales bacterium]